jgi:hypothetical protein
MMPSVYIKSSLSLSSFSDVHSLSKKRTRPPNDQRPLQPVIEAVKTKGR